ncbi:hypothetical protein RR46_07360 [Papilio xuthus]|uniref:Uncharacterized protein n=1 Tax=Papilio xuthus TaxID=66420 RepID=A0A194PX71_PAPXU|nr:hypothetical protein RR46_07360 [Papilio xuthus]
MRELIEYSCRVLNVEEASVEVASARCRAYVPSWLEEAVQKWREAGRDRGTKTWKLLADPQRYSNLFPDYLTSLELEYYQRRFLREQSPPAAPLGNRGRRLAEERARMEAEGKFKMPDFTKLRNSRGGEEPALERKIRERRESIELAQELDECELDTFLLDAEAEAEAEADSDKYLQEVSDVLGEEIDFDSRFTFKLHTKASVEDSPRGAPQARDLTI